MKCKMKWNEKYIIFVAAKIISKESKDGYIFEWYLVDFGYYRKY